LLAAVCILKDATFEKKEIVNINMKALQSTFEKISKSCEKIMYCVEDKKKT
jgi:Pyruvate/2-oxoacid:ferredoxin oxidoreductase gamma subunit